MTKIYIGGSMHFAKEMLETKKYFDNSGWEAIVPADANDCLINPELDMDDEHCYQFDIMRDCMNKLAECDVALFLNHPKNGEDGYIGASTLIELGLAYYLNKRIYLLNQPPSKEKFKHMQEVFHMKPIIINGDLSKVI